MMSPSSFAVRALKFLQKSMMLTPCGPSAVPTGGAGVALPAALWSFPIACTFFAMCRVYLFLLALGLHHYHGAWGPTPGALARAFALARAQGCRACAFAAYAARHCLRQFFAWRRASSLT